MNWLDITFVCLIGLALVKGLFDGIIKQVVSLIAVVIAFLFSGKAAGVLMPYLAKLEWFEGNTLTVMSYVAAFLVILAACILVAELLHRLIDVTPLGILNHLFGALLGGVTMVLLLSLFLNVWDVIDPKATILFGTTRNESRLYPTVKAIVPTLFPQLDLRKFGLPLPSPKSQSLPSRQRSRTLEI